MNIVLDSLILGLVLAAGWFVYRIVLLFIDRLNDTHTR